jgi:hypothetical protein
MTIDNVQSERRGGWLKLQLEHDRMFRELFGDDDGETGLIKTLRDDLHARKTRADDEAKHHNQNLRKIGTLTFVVGIGMLILTGLQVWAMFRGGH